MTEDGRLSAKDIVGNRKKLTWWQDEFWKHMVKKYPELERGESASETGREHIPPRLYKEAVHLNNLRDNIMELLAKTNMLNAKSHAAEIGRLMDEYIPGVEKMKTKLKKYGSENKALKEEKATLETKLKTAEEAGKEKISTRLKYAEMDKELRELQDMLENIPPEIVEAYRHHKEEIRENER